MRVVHFVYNNQEVDFLPNGEGNVMVNATQMAAIFGKRLDVFLKSEHAQAFIKAMLNLQKEDQNGDLSPQKRGDKLELFPPYGGNNFDEDFEEYPDFVGMGLEQSEANKFLVAQSEAGNFKYTLDQIIRTNKRGGTWMHRVLALKFAAWLDPSFEVWVFETADKIILGHYREQKLATEAKLRAEHQMRVKRQQLLERYPEFEEFLLLEQRVNSAEKRRVKAVRASVEQLKLDLFSSLHPQN
jgi:hypothetical protein